MENDNWESIRESLTRILDNGARIFSEDDLRDLGHLVNGSDGKSAAKLIGFFLQNGPLEGELLQIYAQKIGRLIGETVEVESETYLPIQERSAWVTNPETAYLN